jgi:hypothetical protein
MHLCRPGGSETSRFASTIGVARPSAGDVQRSLTPRWCHRPSNFQRCHHTITDLCGNFGQNLGLDQPQLGRPGRRLRRYAQYPIAQDGRGGVFGDVLTNHGRPLPEYRTFSDLR